MKKIIKIVLLLGAIALMGAACNQPAPNCKVIGHENGGQERDIWQCPDGSMQIQ